MRIGIDARVLDRKITGTGRYLLNLLYELPQQDSKNEYVLFTNADLDIDQNFYKVVRIEKSIVPFKIFSPYYLNVILPRLIKKEKIDVLFSPNILIPIVKMEGVKFISVVHDVIPWVYPGYYPYLYKKYLSFFVPRSLQKSDIVITVSKHSMRDIINTFGLPEDKIRVVHNTASDKFIKSNKVTNDLLNSFKDLDLPDNYLLYVGVIEPRKNVMGLIKIFDELNRKGSNLRLVIVGKPGYNSQSIMNEIAKRGKNIIHFPYLFDDPLAHTFKNAFAFIFPSYYEGFGIPPLEAMQCGIPVLASNRSSLTEVVGEGGILYDPDNHDKFVEDIIKLENDSDFYNLMKSKSLKQAAKFNIKETANKLINILNEVGYNIKL
ncbi:glycosyltransferase family 4 protein [Bacteroidota bacterium]